MRMQFSYYMEYQYSEYRCPPVRSDVEENADLNELTSVPMEGAVQFDLAPQRDFAETAVQGIHLEVLRAQAWPNRSILVDGPV
jgi:hypothetical protein